MPIIEARGLAKIYRNAVKKPGVLGAIGHIFNPKYTDSVAVDGVDLSVEPGESLGYVGPNGAGKSTTIKMLTGILMPSAGTVRVNGLDPYRQRMENTRKIGVVFGQRTQLWWDIAVIESFTLIRDIYGVSRKRYAENLAYLTELLGLEPFLGLSARKLSLGQRMRADLAVSLLYDPEVLFLDEPTIGLDVAVKERIREFLKRVNREKGVTIILTSHDLDDIQDVCSRLVIIDKGSIIYDGTHGELLDRAVKNRRMHMRLASGGARLRGMLAGVEGMSLVSGSETELAVDFDRFRFSAKDVISRAMADAEVLDFRLEEPDIEDVIKSVYNGRLALG